MSLSVSANAGLVNQQPTQVGSEWSNFFANLSGHLSSRVKKRDSICSVRILTNEETGGSTSVKVFSTNGIEPAHTHYETKQIFIVLDGELTVWLSRENEGQIEKTLKRGEYLFINPGESHGFSGTALVGGVDIGKGTSLDTYEEGEHPNIPPKLSLTPMLPMNQGTVTIQTADLEQRELLCNQEWNIEILAETMTGKISSISDSNRMVVIVSGQALKTNQNGDTQKCLPGDLFFISPNESYTVAPVSETPPIMILFNLR